MSKDPIDLEQYAKNGKTPPDDATAFRIRIDKTHYDVDVPSMTGEQILRLAGKDPPSNFRLVQRVRGSQPLPVQLTDVVTFTAPGIERFNTLPLDQTEGEASEQPPRRDFEVGEEDRDYLDSLGLRWDAIREGNTQWILIRRLPVPDGYTIDVTDAGVQLPPGYPDAQIDMAYFHPALVRKDGGTINATQVTVNLEGKPYQRWSRHRTAENPWRRGVDGVVTHVELVKHWLQREFK